MKGVRSSSSRLGFNWIDLHLSEDNCLFIRVIWLWRGDDFLSALITSLAAQEIGKWRGNFTFFVYLLYPATPAPPNGSISGDLIDLFICLSSFFYFYFINIFSFIYFVFLLFCWGFCWRCVATAAVIGLIDVAGVTGVYRRAPSTSRFFRCLVALTWPFDLFCFPNKSVFDRKESRNFNNILSEK